LGSAKRTRLETTVAAIQGRWGTKALRKAAATDVATATPHIATGFSSLDQALGIGGIPRGRISELLGVSTSGMSTLALKVIASAQTAGDQAAYIDLGHTFDPDYAARCGVRVSKMALIRPHAASEALEITHALIARGGVGIAVFDSVTDLLAEAHGAQAMSVALRQLNGALAASSCALLFLTPLYFGDALSLHNYPSGFALPHYVSIRLLLEKEGWLKARRDIRGYQARVTVLKNKLAACSGPTSIAITFDGVVKGNGT
jgi:recombination protein RecA